MEKLALSMIGIQKSFPGVQALAGVDFNLRKGEVHALLGINGAGKSTLIKILSGIYSKDAGEIYIHGRLVEIDEPLEAKSLGIATVYQDPQVIPSFVGYENIFLGAEAEGNSVFSIINRKNLKERAQRLLEKFPFNVDLTKPVLELETIEKEAIAVLRALSQENTSILVLDEPTSILAYEEIRILREQIQVLKERGISIIYITHRLNEIFDIADRFTVLRDGKNVGTYAVDETLIDTNKIAELMLGEKLSQMYPQRDSTSEEEILRTENLSLVDHFENVNLSVHKGEILGIFGLVGSGFDELCKSLYGINTPESGHIFIKGKEVNQESVSDAEQNGIFLIPGDRRIEGQISEENICFNTTLSNLGKIATKLGLIKLRKERKDTNRMIDLLGISTPSATQKVALLSGGNQQKVVIGKGLYAKRDIYIFEEPTIGVDVGAKSGIYKLIRELSKEKAVIVASSDCEEIFSICDHAVVLHKGQVVLDKPINETRLDEMLLYGLTGGIDAKK
mgnify:CR=1 FL=1